MRDGPDVIIEPAGDDSESSETAPSVHTPDGFPDDVPLAVIGHFRNVQKVNGKWKHVHWFDWHDVVGEADAIDKGFELSDHEDFLSSSVIDSPELDQLKSFFEESNFTREQINEFILASLSGVADPRELSPASVLRSELSQCRRDIFRDRLQEARGQRGDEFILAARRAQQGDEPQFHLVPRVVAYASIRPFCTGVDTG